MFNLMFIHEDTKNYLISSFPEGLSKKFYSYGLVYNPVHDSIRYGLLPDNIIPVLYWYLGCDDCGFFTISVFNDIHQVHSGLSIKRLHAEVIQYKQVRSFYLLKFLQYIPLGFGYF